MNNCYIEKMISDMRLAKNQYELAKETNIGLERAKEQMKNIAFNYFQQLLECAENNQKLQDEINTLNIALEDSDKELSELKKKAAPAPAQAPASAKKPAQKPALQG